MWNTNAERANDFMCLRFVCGEWKASRALESRRHGTTTRRDGWEYISSGKKANVIFLLLSTTTQTAKHHPYIALCGNCVYELVLDYGRSLWKCFYVFGTLSTTHLIYAAFPSLTTPTFSISVCQVCFLIKVVYVWLFHGNMWKFNVFIIKTEVYNIVFLGCVLWWLIIMKW